MKESLNVLDIITGASGVGAIISAQDLAGVLSIVLTALSLASMLASMIVRIVAHCKAAKSKDSDGGEQLTAAEIVAIADELKSTSDYVKEEAEKLKEKKND